MRGGDPQHPPRVKGLNFWVTNTIIIIIIIVILGGALNLSGLYMDTSACK